VADPARPVLLVEPFLGGSHRAWAEGLARHSRHRVTLLSHPGRFWRWRMRGSALTLAADTEAAVARDGPPDVVVVSDMIDLPAYLGFTRRVLGDAPVALYLHENQLVHAPGPTGATDEVYATINWLSMAAADRTYCNSAFHRDALLAALPDFLARAPDRPHDGFFDAVAARTGVLPMGVDVEDLVDARRRSAFDEGEPPLILWNQRWDHDKDPVALFRVLRALARDGVPFGLALAGTNTRADPQEFQAIRADLGDRVVHTGWLPRAAYVELLARADVVVSTARHELFGIAMVEAMAAGAVPVLPDRLSYPEVVPAWAHPAVLYRSRLYDHLHAVLTDLPAARARVAGLRDDMRRHAWPVVAEAWDREIDRLAAGGAR
jgi:glycosyltransferase involved in cell wall biosynthesis